MEKTAGELKEGDEFIFKKDISSENPRKYKVIGFIGKLLVRTRPVDDGIESIIPHSREVIIAEK